MIRTLFTLLISLMISGCVSTYEHSELQVLQDKLDPSKGVLISIPEDGWYGSTEYKNSGRMTANAVRSAFAKNARHVELATDCQPEICLQQIDGDKYGYFVEPIVLHWEDRATEWSGIPDRIEIQLVVYDARTKKEIANSSYTGESKFWTFGGDHPQDLLLEPTNAYVNTLYH